MFNSITDAIEMLKQAQEKSEGFFMELPDKELPDIELPDIEPIHSNPLDKESIKSFINKLEEILTPSQLNELIINTLKSKT